MKQQERIPTEEHFYRQTQNVVKLIVFFGVFVLYHFVLVQR